MMRAPMLCETSSDAKSLSKLVTVIGKARRRDLVASAAWAYAKVHSPDASTVIKTGNDWRVNITPRFAEQSRARSPYRYFRANNVAETVAS